VKKNNQEIGSDKRPETENIQAKAGQEKTALKDTVKSERIRFKNADEIYD